MSAQTRGLGRGLGALIPTSTTQGHPSGSPDQAPDEIQPAGLLQLPIQDISPNPRQPRTQISAASLEELAASIRQHGLIQPVIVTKAQRGDLTSYVLVAGERRWRAAQLAGLKMVPAAVKETTPQQLLELALVENIQRADLNPLEEAGAYMALITDFNLTQQAVAERVGKSRVAVANAVRLLKLPDLVKRLLAEDGLSEGHARALLGLPDDSTIERLAQEVVARDLTVRQTEERVRRLLSAGEGTESAPNPGAAGDPHPAETRRLEEAFRDTLGTKVSLTRGRRGGKLVIHFYSDEELQAIYDYIVSKDGTT